MRGKAGAAGAEGGVMEAVVKEFTATMTVLAHHGRSSWTFNRGDRVKVTRIGQHTVLFEAVDIAVPRGPYVMAWSQFEMSTRTAGAEKGE